MSDPDYTQNMKTALITTLYSNHNYGAMLQAHALQSYLKTVGVDASILDFHGREREPGLFRLPKKLRRAFHFYRKMVYLKERQLRYEAFQLFLEDFINLRGLPGSGCSLLICGSDQIWNPNLPLCDEFFLQFGDAGIPRVSYAASFGNSDVPPALHAELKSLLATI